MMEFTTRIYELEEAFIKTILTMEDDGLAFNAFKKYRDLNEYAENKYNFMADFMNEVIEKGQELFSPVLDSHREVFDLDSGLYYCCIDD